MGGFAKAELARAKPVPQVIPCAVCEPTMHVSKARVCAQLKGMLVRESLVTLSPLLCRDTKVPCGSRFWDLLVRSDMQSISGCWSECRHWLVFKWAQCAQASGNLTNVALTWPCSSPCHCKATQADPSKGLSPLLFFIDLVSSREQDMTPGFLNSSYIDTDSKFRMP